MELFKPTYGMDSVTKDIFKLGDVAGADSGFAGLMGSLNAGMSPLTNLIKDNSALFGLAGMGFDLFNNNADRREQRKVNAFNMDQATQRLDMTKKSYDNELYRSNAIEDQMAGGKSRYSGQRQYMGDNPPGSAPSPQPAPPAQGLASSAVPRKQTQTL